MREKVLNIDDFKGGRVHFVGIGGASMSGLAQILKSMGYEVSGSDMAAGPATDKLAGLGIPINIGHDGDAVEGAALIVYTAAARQSNAERLRAFALDIPQMDRATLLGQLMLKYRDEVGISGTHGKSSTTSMISQLLITGGKNPTFHIGAELASTGSSVCIGGSGIFVTEADEYAESFLKFNPTVAVITNIDADHLEYYHDIETIERTFEHYASLLPARGVLIVCGEDERAMRVLRNATCAFKLSYGFSAAHDYWADEITFDSDGLPRYILMHEDERLCAVKLTVPGRHNVLNSLAAIAVGIHFGVNAEICAKALGEFMGAKRRYEYMGEARGAKLYTDYSHHPTEVRCLLDSARMSAHKRIICVFQPHTYSRTKLLFDDFADVLTGADMVVLADIFASREVDPGDIHSRDLQAAVQKLGTECLYMPTLEECAQELSKIIKEGDLVFAVGAGTVFALPQMVMDTVNLQ